MVQFNDWCDSADTPAGNHHVRVITGRPADSATGIQVTATALPVHYAAEERIAGALARLGKPAAAKMITDLLPQTPQIRSGDLGEIYATEWINAHSGYRAPIKRLRWKDHRNMAMRGDDVIGMILDPATQRLRFLKTEAKSRIDLRAQTLQEARIGLDKDGGLPSSHALSWPAAGGCAWSCTSSRRARSCTWPPDRPPPWCRTGSPASPRRPTARSRANRWRAIQCVDRYH